MWRYWFNSSQEYFFRASSSLNGKTLVFETKNIGSIPMSYINKNNKKTSDRVVIVEAC